MMDPLDRIIWSADVGSLPELGMRLRENPELKFIKLDRLFLTDKPLLHIQRIQDDHDVRVFVDAKIVEIPSKVEALAKKYVKYRPWMLNCMAGCLSSGVWGHAQEGEQLDGLRRFADVCLEAEVKPCAVTVLTSKEPYISWDEFRRKPSDQVLFYTERLIKSLFTDIVCSPQEAQLVRERFGDVITINCPGIRLPDAKADDQARIATPSGAVVAGADRLVIGRPITNGQLHLIIEDLSSAEHGKQ